MIVLQHITKTYNSGGIRFCALQDVSLEIAEGAFVAVKGPSGSGKTTLLNILGTLDSPTGGSYLFAGEEIGGLRPKEKNRFRRETLGFIFQNFNLIPELTVYENIEVPLLIVKERNRKARVLQAAEAVGLGGHLKHRPSQLSGGQQQRVSIARAVVKHPALILADEPTANLDSKTGSGIVELLSRLRKEYGSTIVLTSHDEQVLQKADRCITLHDGSVVSG
ncbi:MAG: ABC transporter ATP-binding protein [Treponema sp.]